MLTSCGLVAIVVFAPCPPCRDCGTFLVTFVVSLLFDVVPGLVAGILTSWFFSLTLPYDNVPVLRMLKFRLDSAGSKTLDTRSTRGSCSPHLVDGLSLIQGKVVRNTCYCVFCQRMPSDYLVLLLLVQQWEVG